MRVTNEYITQYVNHCLSYALSRLSIALIDIILHNDPLERNLINRGKIIIKRPMLHILIHYGLWGSCAHVFINPHEKGFLKVILHDLRMLVCETLNNES